MFLVMLVRNLYKVELHCFGILFPNRSRINVANSYRYTKLWLVVLTSSWDMVISTWKYLGMENIKDQEYQACMCVNRYLIYFSLLSIDTQKIDRWETELSGFLFATKRHLYQLVHR